MFTSSLEIFKIGVGPSSSHTIGPMVAAARFLDMLRDEPAPAALLQVSLHGSLAFTGHGHSTDRAVMLGLCGIQPETYVAEDAEVALERLGEIHAIALDGFSSLRFNPDSDLLFDYESVFDEHPNALTFRVLDENGEIVCEETFFSIGGGFVVTVEEFRRQEGQSTERPVEFPFGTASQLLEFTSSSGKSVAQIMISNECSIRPASETEAALSGIWQAMNDCIERGLATDGTLPGGLEVKRRAPGIHRKLTSDYGVNQMPPHIVHDWICAYAMAVNEENAGGGKVVTAPTNGAAGVIPATIKYYLDHVPGAKPGKIVEFLLTAAAIGGIIKRNASISGAECGCQAEVGSASAMAAAGLAAVLGATPEQVENAAEIALEHHLGLTCDPVNGLVQIPCIERNGIGAIKAISAASLSLRGDGTHHVSLDSCIETMRQTGADMSAKYKETSIGGLAVNVANC